MSDKWPTSSTLTQVFLKVLMELGGSGSVSELDQKVISRLNLSPELLSIKRSGNRGEIQYRLAWVRTKAKQNGLVTKEKNRIWKISEKGLSAAN